MFVHPQEGALLHMHSLSDLRLESNRDATSIDQLHSIHGAQQLIRRVKGDNSLFPETPLVPLTQLTKLTQLTSLALKGTLVATPGTTMNDLSALTGLQTLCVKVVPSVLSNEEMEGLILHVSSSAQASRSCLGAVIACLKALHTTTPFTCGMHGFAAQLNFDAHCFLAMLS